MAKLKIASFLAAAPTKVLRAGTILYHGTNSAGDFQHPDGPAWFTPSLKIGLQWAGWSESLPDGRTKGDKRVLSYRVVQDVTLLSFTAKVWSGLGLILCDDEEPSPWDLAHKLVGCVPGWMSTESNGEVMLTTPSEVLEFVDIQPVAKSIKSFGGGL